MDRGPVRRRRIGGIYRKEGVNRREGEKRRRDTKIWGNDVRKNRRVSVQNMVKVKSVPKKFIDKKRWEGAYAPMAVFMAKDNKALMEVNTKLEQRLLDVEDEKNAIRMEVVLLEETNEMVHSGLITANIELAEARGAMEQMTQLARNAIRELRKREMHSRKKDEKIRKLKSLLPNVTDRVAHGMPRLTPTSFFEQRMEDIMDIGWLASDEVLSEEEEV